MVAGAEAKMTIDDESSIYVGGLPYSATEETLRQVFNIYGSVVDVKVPPLFALLYTPTHTRLGMKLGFNVSITSSSIELTIIIFHFRFKFTPFRVKDIVLNPMIFTSLFHHFNLYQLKM